MSHEDADVRKWAVDVHPYLELSDGEIIAALVKGVEDPNCEVAGTACKALCDLAKKEFDVSAAMPALVRLLDRRECDRIHGVYLAFEHACEILAMLPEKQAKAAVEPLCRSLSSGSPKVVTSAAEALWKIDKQVDASLPRLKELLDDGELLPESFCDVLFQIGPAASSLMGDVLKLLAKGDWDTQWAAADALGSMASTDPACVSALIAALQHPSGIVRGAAIQALSKIGKDAVRPLIQTLREGDDEQKEMAADALGVIGSEAEEAVSDLMSLMKSSEEGVRDWSAIALGKIAGCEAAVPTLTTILRLREGPNIRAQASEALGNIGPKARAALSLLQAALRDDDENVQSAAADAIMKIDEGS